MNQKTETIVVGKQEFEALFPKFQPSRLTITPNSGESYSTRVDVPKGDPRDPMTEAEIVGQALRLPRKAMASGSA